MQFIATSKKALKSYKKKKIRSHERIAKQKFEGLNCSHQKAEESRRATKSDERSYGKKKI